jgi:Lamin Tail Domain
MVKMKGSGLLTLVLAVMFASMLPGAADASLAINEIMADPASDWDGDGEYEYRYDEWVELYNAGPDVVDLGNYGLSDDADLWTYGFAPGEMLGVGEAVVMFGSQSIAWQQANGMSQYGFKLSNDGDTVILWQFAEGDTIPVDSYTYLSHEADDDRSSGRNPDGTGVWELFDGLNNYGGITAPSGNNLLPTPGYSNLGSPPPTAVGESSWGFMKSLYR